MPKTDVQNPYKAIVAAGRLPSHQARLSDPRDAFLPQTFPDIISTSLKQCVSSHHTDSPAQTHLADTAAVKAMTSMSAPLVTFSRSVPSSTVRRSCWQRLVENARKNPGE